MNILGVLLAGGQARRMGGGDKGLSMISGRSMIELIIERAKSQVSKLIINANGDTERFEKFGLEVTSDVIKGFAGPLAGVLTGLEWARFNAPRVNWVATFPTDAPFMPLDLVQRLVSSVDVNGADLACACSNGQSHPVFGLWPVNLADDLRRAMVDERVRKIDSWTARYKLAEVDFSEKHYDPFFNINAPEHLIEAERIMNFQKK
jgi:molybdopterin-guanine dinucleotide biosynthesis protein A